MSGVPSVALETSTQTARAAGLRYVSDRAPGIHRVRRGRSFTYVAPGGRPMRDEPTVRRIAALAIPPAWRDVWICPDANGHIQAVGRDARGRKQYRYHPQWRTARDLTKFGRLIAFARALPRIRRALARDLALPGLPREKVLAAALRVMEHTALRVGNEEYARQNGSYGLTTLRDGHVCVRGGKARFSFRGKSGVRQALELQDPPLARIIKRCQDLPGQELFQYLDDAGEHCPIDSGDLNDYLRSLAGASPGNGEEDFSTKDFRTWIGTVCAAVALCALGECRTDAQRRKSVVEAVKQTAQWLGNRPATCRKFYIHPAIVEAHLRGALAETMGPVTSAALEPMVIGLRRGLSRTEKAVLATLERAARSGGAASRRPAA